MKIFRFAFRDIAASLRSHFALLLVIVLGIATALVTHLVTFGFLEQETVSKKSYSRYNTVSALHVNRFDEALYERIATRDDVQNAFCFFYPENESYLLIGWLGSTPQTWFPVGEGGFLSEAKIDKPAYVSSDVGQYRPGLQQKLLVMGEEYEIVGNTFLMMSNLQMGLEPSLMTEMDDARSFVFIRLEEFTRLNISDACVRVHFKYEQDLSSKDFEKAAEEIFGAEMSTGESIALPPSPIKEVMAENIVFFISIGLLCMLAYMNIIAMYWHRLSSDRRKYQICSILGAKSKTLFAVVLIKYLALFVLAFILSIVAAILAKPLFAYIEIEYVLNAKTLAPVFFFEFVATLLISLPKMLGVVSAKNFRKNLLRRGNG